MRHPVTIRNLARTYIEDEAIGFAMWCDEHELTVGEGEILAEALYDELSNTADERTGYLPDDRGTEYDDDE